MDGVGELERRIGQMRGAGGAVWLLDIDGVLNALSGECAGWPRQERAELHTFGGGVTQLHYAPDLMRLLNLLHERRLVEFRWLTTWEEDGPGVFAPLVGLDVGDRVAGRADDEEPWWKLRAFRSTNDALVIWTDDETPDDVLGLPGVVRPAPATGLTPDDLTRILDALEFAHGSQGLDVRLGRR